MKAKKRPNIKERFKRVKKFFKENTITAMTAVFLGITTLLVAWAGWIGALHESNQAGNYAKSNNLAAEGNAAYNVAAQVYVSDLFTWNTISTLQLDREAALREGDQAEANVIKNKIAKIKENNSSPYLLEAIEKTTAEGNNTSPFENAEFTDGYFKEAKSLLAESQEFLEKGNQDNLRSDSYQLSSVLFSLVLFLLGIIGVLNDYQSRKALLVFSVCVLAVAIIYMLTIPMPTGFNFAEFFNIK